MIKVFVFLLLSSFSIICLAENETPSSLNNEQVLNATSENPHAEEAFVCPEGASLKGAKPPEGNELKCEDQQGRLQGPYQRWYPSGVVMQKGHYKDGREHGEQLSWWPNGKLMARGTSIHGKRYKAWEFWDIHGKPKTLSVKTEKITVPAEESGVTVPQSAKPTTKNSDNQPLIYRSQ